jgi:hypothetical protein
VGIEDNQRKIHRFLCKHFKSQKSFTRSELFEGTTYKKASQNTYWSKQISQLVKEDTKGKYKVGRRFGLFQNWKKFQKGIVSQTLEVDAKWKHESFKAVLNFEFFLPLAHEVLLRKLLDDIFYRDSLRILFETIDRNELKKRFAARKGETYPKYLQRLSKWVSKKFGGYSITHVSGRFRAQDLMTREKAARSTASGDPYLIDETSAVVRFIVTCDEGVQDSWESSDIQISEETLREALNIRWFFYELFVKSMLEVVRDEQQLWMVESGVFRRLHVWSTGTPVHSI